MIAPRTRLLASPSTPRDWGKGFVPHELTGGLAVAAHYSVMWLLFHAAAEPVATSAVGFCAGAHVCFVLKCSTVFAPTSGVPVTMLRFVAALGLQRRGKAALLDALLSAGLSLWVAQVCTTVAMTFVNFLGYRRWGFR